MAGLNLLKLDSGRQAPIVAHKKLTYDQLLGQSGNQARGIFVPQGAQLLSVTVDVETAWNSATSDTLTLKDEAGNTILAATSIAAASRFAATAANLGAIRTASDYVGFVWTGVGDAPTAGELHVWVTYAIVDRDLFNEGLDGYPNTGHA